MNTTTTRLPPRASGEIKPADPPATRRRRGSRGALSMLAQGEPFVWLTGGALILCLVMILALLALVAALGLSTFRPAALLQVDLEDGRVLLGEVTKTEKFPLTATKLLGEPPATRDRILRQLADELGEDWSSIPDELRTMRGHLEAEVEELNSRFAITEQRLERLARRATDETASAFTRRIEIADSSRSKALVQAQAELQALKQRLGAIEQEQQQLETAIDFFAASANQNVDRLLEADLSVARLGTDALLQRVAVRRGEDAVEVRRRLLRTGNYELTNEHFNWVSDYEIAEAGESHPALAATVERISWGRFYGFPEKFTARQQRAISTSEQQLRELCGFLHEHLDMIPLNDATAAQQQLADLEESLQEVRMRDARTFLATLPEPSDSSPLSQVETTDGERKSPDQLEASDVVSAALLVWDDPQIAWQQFLRHHATVRDRYHRQQRLEKHDLGRIFAQQEQARLRIRQAELDHDLELMEGVQHHLSGLREQQQAQNELARITGLVQYVREQYDEQSPIRRWAEAAFQHCSQDLQEQQQAAGQTIRRSQEAWDELPADARTAVADYVQVEQLAGEQTRAIQAEIEQLKQDNARYALHMLTADGQQKSLALADVVRAYLANQASGAERAGIYFSRWWEFLSDEPREANSEGGVVPAIWGTVTMTLMMSLAVVPFGVLASLYLREYARSGVIISTIRIAINNLAGVPSIVFGVFGLGFFCYIIGAYIDGGPQNAGFRPLPPARWYFLTGGLAFISLAAFLAALLSLAGPRGARSTLRQAFGYGSMTLWLLALVLFFYLLIKTPFFGGFYEANLPNPYWGKGGVLWASLTLALMTLPVVIVATEEALSAVPNSMREGSYGCGASKWQTIRRIVLPQALPGIMTGMILAMARGAGEVAPLMLVGAVKMAPELPLDGTFPYLHGNRSFMHLGFHIFDVGFQSQNSEAAKPMVYTTTLLLIVIITLLNLMAVQLRAYLRKRFVSGQF